MNETARTHQLTRTATTECHSQYHVAEPARSVSVAGSYDVLVCGGGTSGIPAAIAAAREGARVGLIERYGFLGGVPAMNIMPCWHGLRDHHSGLLSEWARRAAALMPGPDPLDANHIEPETIKLLALEMLCEAGVELHLHTVIVDTLTDGATVTGVVTESKSGRRAFLAKRVIDATGDGDVAYLAGAEYLKGDAEGRIQGMTVRLRIGGIDFGRYFDWIAENRQYYRVSDEQLQRIRGRALNGQDFYMPGDLAPLYREHNEGRELPVASYFNCSSIRPGELSCNATRVELLDGTIEEDLTRAEIGCRRQALALYTFLREHVPGFTDARLVETAPQIGVRESRCIVGDYVLTEEDCRSGRVFEDSLHVGHVAFDLHNPGHYTCEHVPEPAGIPYRCLPTKGLEHIAVIGRAMSADHVANSSARVMYKVFTVGQAAGIAAALSLRLGKSFRELPFDRLREAMAGQGMAVVSRQDQAQTVGA